MKVATHGEVSVHVCISLSGLADAYLGWSKTDPTKLPLARAEAERMLSIATKINSAEQIRIAKEILADIVKAEGAPAGGSGKAAGSK
jgi:hypothetical protein